MISKSLRLLNSSPSTDEIPTPRLSRYESLDIWRGVACLSIVIYHVAGVDRRIESTPLIVKAISKLYFGVPIFFVISGYCIAATCDSSRRKDMSLRWFLRRRFRRIFPAYWICLAIVSIAAGFGIVGIGVADPLLIKPAQWLGNLTLTEWWRPKLFGEKRAPIMGHAWTLCYEEQFYLVCGFLLFATRRHFFLGLAVLTALSVPPAVFNWSGALDLYGLFFDGHWLQFASGVLVYYGRNYSRPWVQRLDVGLLLGAAVATSALRLTMTRSRLENLSFSGADFLDGTSLAFLFAALLMAIGRWDGTVANSILLRPLRACGLMCYSLYLVHQSVIVAVRLAAMRLGLGGVGTTVGIGEAALTVLCCIVVGICFYQVVERRFLNTPSLVIRPNIT